MHVYDEFNTMHELSELRTYITKYSSAERCI